MAIILFRLSTKDLIKFKDILMPISDICPLLNSIKLMGELIETVCQIPDNLEFKFESFENKHYVDCFTVTLDTTGIGWRKWRFQIYFSSNGIELTYLCNEQTTKKYVYDNWEQLMPVLKKYFLTII